MRRELREAAQGATTQLRPIGIANRQYEAPRTKHAQARSTPKHEARPSTKHAQARSTKNQARTIILHVFPPVGRTYGRDADAGPVQRARVVIRAQVRWHPRPGL